MEDVIYVVILIAKIDSLEKDPPEIVSIKPIKLLEATARICSASSLAFTPGAVM